MADEQPPSPKPLDRRWRSGEPQSPGKTRPRSAKRGQIIAGVVVILLLAGAVASLLLFIHPFQAPYFLTIPVTEYTARQYPPNPFARQDSDALQQRFPADRRKNAFESQERHEILKELHNLQTRKDSAIVIHLRAHALSRGDEVYILPGDANPDDSSTWLPFTEVLQLLRQCPAQHKLLILDVMQPLMSPRLGILTNDVAGKVKTLVETSDNGNLLVLCACSSGQVSLVSEEMNQSVFGYYLDQGLRGHADGQGSDGKSDGRITVKELAAFVSKRVDRWAVRNRGTQQTPVLLGKGDDFGLVVFDRQKIEPAAEPGEIPPYPAWLDKGWTLRDQWWNDESYNSAPQSFRRLEALLLHAEQRWRGGTPAEGLQSQLNLDSSKCANQLARAERMNVPRPYSLAQAHEPGWKADAGAATALQKMLAGLDLDPPANPDEKKKADEEMKKARKEFLARFKGSTAFFDLAGTVVEAAVQDPAPSARKIIFLNDLLQPPQQRYVETLFLQRLADMAYVALMTNRPWPTATVQQSLRTMNEAVKTTTFDPRGLPWIEPLHQAATDKRREGEALLFSGRRDGWENAGKPLNVAEEGYQNVNKYLNAFQQAYASVDEAMTMLPGYVPYLVSRANWDAAEQRNWSSIVQATCDLQQLLANPSPERLPSADDLLERTQSLRQMLNTLHQPFTGKAVEQLIKKADQDDPKTYLEIQARLASPRLESRDREALWLSGRKLARRLHLATVAIDQAEDRGTPPSSAGPAVSGDSILEATLAARSAQLSIDLLKLGGLVDASQLDKDRMAADKKKDWVPLAAKLQTAWTKQLSDQYRNEKDLAGRDRLIRILPPFDADAEKLATATDQAPAGQLRRQEMERFCKWLGKQYESEGKTFAGQESNRDFTNFYNDAAQEYLNYVP